MRRILFFVFSALLMVGCASNKVDYNRASLNLRIGMDKTEVQGVMGAPRRTDVNENRERWIFWNPVRIGFTPMDNEHLAQDRLVVTFKDGKVSRWGNQTIADDMMEMNQKIIDSSYEAVREQIKTAP